MGTLWIWELRIVLRFGFERRGYVGLGCFSLFFLCVCSVGGGCIVSVF